MDATQVKAVIEHGFADIEAIETALNHPEAVAATEKIKALLESPLALEGLALGITFGLEKLAAKVVSAAPVTDSAPSA